MALLDSVIGALGQPQGGGQGNVLGALVGMLGQGGTGGTGGAGALAGLVEKFHQGRSYFGALQVCRIRAKLLESFLPLWLIRRMKLREQHRYASLV